MQWWLTPFKMFRKEEMKSLAPILDGASDCILACRPIAGFISGLEQQQRSKEVVNGVVYLAITNPRRVCLLNAITVNAITVNPGRINVTFHK